ncbi:Isoflavone 2'-hydroxylase [Dendrobium catenatum]|uniref:Isoflavone 2'-hydroxylase n=1 Tax=Dendrobium catenatum TaxID=906689 RepID=A0A2I0VR78_9ASPA|nr:Isoflavone 2'-hydroxylase [Dendrobium catenatum]
MDAMKILTSLALFLSFLLVIKLFITNKNKKREKKKPPPSPPNSFPILGHLHLLQKPLHQSLASLSTQHGPILLLRFGNHPALIVSSASIANECFTTNDIALADRPHFPSMAVITYNHTSLPFAAYGPHWREMRRIATVEALSGPRLAFFSDIRADEARSLARSLFHSSGKVEISSSLFGLAMNVMMRIIIIKCVTGKRYYGEKGEKEEAHNFKDVIEKIFSLTGANNVGDFLPAAIGWFARREVDKKLARYHKYRDEIVQSLIEEHKMRRREEEEEEEKEGGLKQKQKIHKTMIDALLSLQDEQPEQYTDVFIKSLINSLIAAGTDTSSNTIEWSMSLLLNNPDKLEKARQEIDDQIGHDRLLEESDLIKLPYLHCIINETFRLYPVAPLLIPHVAREDCEIGGYAVDRGTLLLVNVHKIHRDPAIWSEPTKFLPERFQNAKEEEGSKMTMMPFGMGRRRCPGEGLALKEIGLVLGILIQCFEWKRIGAEEVDMTEGSGLTMPRAKHLEALCRPHQYMMNVLSQI